MGEIFYDTPDEQIGLLMAGHRLKNKAIEKEASK